MKNYILLLTAFLFCLTVSWSQTVEIQGKIISDVSDLENINIYNSTSKKGTITNINGEFVIAVKLEDVLHISAISFKKVTVIITAEIIKNQALTILVNQEVNTLDEVVILSHNLTGELTVDIDNAAYFKPIPLNLITMDHLDFEDIRMNKPDNPFMKQGQLKDGFQPLEILKLMGVSFRKKNKQKPRLDIADLEIKQDVAELYSSEFIHENFLIPFHKIEAFYAFVEAKGIDSKLFKKENEVDLLEFLFLQSKQFLIELHEQN